VTAADIPSIAGELHAAQARLSRRPVDEILAAINAAVSIWLDPESEWRRTAERLLPDAAGFSPEMVRFALPWMLEPLRAPALQYVLDVELGDRRVLDGFVHGRFAGAPLLILHILSGNLPALAAAPIALSLAIKSSALVKAARGDRVFPALFARSLAEVDVELGACVATCYWTGGDRDHEASAFAAADLVVASGNDATLADIRTRCNTRFIGHGHKVSFALVAAEALRSAALARSAARGVALDVSVWDQRGCLSPQLCFVEAAFDEACAFAQLVAGELAALAERLPPGPKTAAEHVAVRRFRDEARWARLAGGRALVMAAEGSTDWTVVVEHLPSFRPTPLCRSLRVLPVCDLADLPRILAPVRPLLEGAGLALPAERAARIDSLLAAAGVHLTLPLGAMQRPPLLWPQGGRPRVADWVTWSHRHEPSD
jgi:hypothetical protein